MSATTTTTDPGTLVPLRVTGTYHSALRRLWVTTYEGATVVHATGGEVTPAVELHTLHSKARKAYTVTLYAVRYEHRDGYRMTVSDVTPAGYGLAQGERPTAVRLTVCPDVLRWHAGTAARLHERWRDAVDAALAGSPGLVSADVAAWMRAVTA